MQKRCTNLSREDLLNHALERNEGVLSKNGALSVRTGSRTGRSPKDRFIVKDSLTEKTIAWGTINNPIMPEAFEALWEQVERYLGERDCVFVSDHRVGADPDFCVPLTITCELAWHALFAQTMFLPSLKEASASHNWNILSAPNFHPNPERDGVHSDAAILLDFTNRRLLVCGTHYSGEMKKGMFTVLNYQLPEQGILSMHCAANQGKTGDVALFFGLSGTGKTTLSTDPKRLLIGDDEIGWNDRGIFNFEGGCYAKCINLSQKNEPEIWGAIRDGAIMENVILDPVTKEPSYDDGSITQNTRAAYPISFVENFISNGMGGQPKDVIFLSCDLFGVLPPVARLTREQASYYFLSGYTALVGSTEVGSAAAIKPTFSACFGAPFFPRFPEVYASLLMKYLDATGATVYLVNTGWTGGPYGKGGKRFDIPTTRAVIHAIVNDEMKKASYQKLPGFNFDVPEAGQELTGIKSRLLDPRLTWEDPGEYSLYATKLIQEFQKNFTKFNAPDIEKAGPVL